mgnify:CR=1 FL=1
MKVLVACEFTGAVRNAFDKLGHDAWSCDLLPSVDGSNRHIQGDVRDILDDGWDMMVAHPPCTRLCGSGVRWLSEPCKRIPPDSTPEEAEAWPKMTREQRLEVLWRHLDKGAELFSDMWNADIPRIAVENPVMHCHAKERIRNYEPAAQTVQPWWFGHEAFKATGLYLKNLPSLIPTNKLTPPKSGTEEHKRWSAIHRAPPGPDRWKFRSKTFQGMADAMADQWGGLLA